jgi:hypothetical protein
MARLRLLHRLVVPLLLVPLATSCASASPEQQVLIDFFQLARLGDHTRLAKIATTTFDPDVAGSVDAFTVVRIGPSQRRTADLTGTAIDRAMATASLTPPGQPAVDPSRLHLDAIAKSVSIDAAFRSPNGRVSRTRLEVMLERAAGVIDGRMREGRWIVKAVARPGSDRR